MTMIAEEYSDTRHTSAPRLLAAGPTAGADRHAAVFGPRPRPVLDVLLDELELAGLTGRGGGSFPAYRKLAATGGRRGAVVIGNGGEGEPWSAKDAVLLENAPHLVIDGLLIAADALGAGRAILSVRSGSLDAVRGALAERRDAARVEIVPAAEGFVAGEASAVVRYLRTGVAKPADRTRRLSEAGLDGRPTLVHNVETLAQLALVARYGGAWFRSSGSPADPGTRLLTVGGDVPDPGVVEAPSTTTIADAIRLAGGEPANAGAALIGGYHGVWVPAAGFGAALSVVGLAPWGAAPGAGVVHVLAPDRCGLAATATVLQELAAASAGQCGPCRFGLPALAARFGEIAGGRLTAEAAAEAVRLADLVDGRGSCHHPDGTARLARSALRVFAADVLAHASGRCVGTGEGER
ncbi:NADH-ubiquinone oxidoreductase-F iron-sulfur binding region domain-containing protein [Leifsonia sp. NPDC058194]|uniref:NADH-ubiquinone oxidoreductase-F iron-sulfur binding region domain-containing protein n=1 Tax=Leifsonia sp. NPDC058194 TaxID=3346374 RepID=UPI0036DB02DC